MLDQKIIDVLNHRISREEFSSRLYKYMGLWLRTKGYGNLSTLYMAYSKEELEHANWAVEYLTNYNITPTLKDLVSPVMDFSSCMQILEETLAHELQITRECEKLHDLGVQLKKPSLQKLALKYCKEQDEEISKALDLLDHAKLTDDMLVFDHYVEKYL